jgi:hypothetical protein
VTSYCADDLVREYRPRAVRPVRALTLATGERIVPERHRFSLDAPIVIRYPHLFVPLPACSERTCDEHRAMVERARRHGGAARVPAPDPAEDDRALGWGGSRPRRPLQLPLRLP